jgi:hypothetical protein
VYVKKLKGFCTNPVSGINSSNFTQSDNFPGTNFNIFSEEGIMSRMIGGVVASIGYVLSLIVVLNIQTGDAPPIGRVIIGVIGLVVVFVYIISLQEHENIMRAGVLALMVLAIMMLAPVIWKAFNGQSLNVLQVVASVIGAILIFVSWRMLPR